MQMYLTDSYIILLQIRIHHGQRYSCGSSSTLHHLRPSSSFPLNLPTLDNACVLGILLCRPREHVDVRLLPRLCRLLHKRTILHRSLLLVRRPTSNRPPRDGSNPSNAPSRGSHLVCYSDSSDSGSRRTEVDDPEYDQPDFYTRVSVDVELFEGEGEYEDVCVEGTGEGSV